MNSTEVYIYQFGIFCFCNNVLRELDEPLVVEKGVVTIVCDGNNACASSIVDAVGGVVLRRRVIGVEDVDVVR